MPSAPATRRAFLSTSAALLSTGALAAAEPAERPKARVAITLDLEMSRHYPRRGMTEWDYQKGNLDEATKRYAAEAGEIVRERGGQIHYFCVGRVLEQADIAWLARLAAAGHPIGNHTYDHVNLLAATPEQTQFRFQRAPWLVAGKSVDEVLRENIRLTTIALRERAGVEVRGFRTPGGFAEGLAGRDDLQAMLQDLGFTWVSSKYPRHEAGQPRQRPNEAVFRSIVEAQRRAQPFVYPSGLIEVPMSPISDVNAFRTHFWPLDDFLTAIRLSVAWAIEHGAVFDFLAHPSCLVVEDPHHQVIRLICDLVEQAGERAEIVSLDAIAEQASNNG